MNDRFVMNAASTHMKLLDLPVFPEILSYLDGLYGSDLFTFSLTNRACRSFVTQHPSMKMLWYTMLRRASHHKLESDSFSLMIHMTDCYPFSEEKYSGAAFSNNLDDVRRNYGECCQPAHYRYAVDAPDPKYGFGGRNVYKEWQVMMWRRMKRTYWNVYDDRKVAKLELELARLKEKKELSNVMVDIYGKIGKKQNRKN